MGKYNLKKRQKFYLFYTHKTELYYIELQCKREIILKQDL